MYNAELFLGSSQMDVTGAGKRIVAAGMLALAAFALTGCSSDNNPATPPSAAPPTSKLGTTVSNITYCTGAGIAQTLDFYYPTQASSALYPVVVYIHGGQLIMGSKNAPAGSPADMWKSTLTPQGYAFVSINYRLGPANKFPAMIEDAKCAIRYLRANAATYNINPNRIGVTGTSSGGYLAALVALSTSPGLEGNGGWPGVSSRVQAAVVEYGADMDLRQPNYSAAEVEGRTQAYPQPVPADITASGTVILHVSSDDPPFLFFHGEKDMLVDRQDNIDINNALKAVGVSSNFTLVLNAGHGWDNAFGPLSPTWDQILQTELTFFNTYLKN